MTTEARSLTPTLGSEVVISKYNTLKERHVFRKGKVLKVSATRFALEVGNDRINFYLSKYNGWQQVVEGGRQNRDAWRSHEWEIASATQMAESEARYARSDAQRRICNEAYDMMDKLQGRVRSHVRNREIDLEQKQSIVADAQALLSKLQEL